MWYGVFTGHNGDRDNIPYLDFFAVRESTEASTEDVIKRFSEKEDMRTGTKIQYILALKDDFVRDVASCCCYNKELPVSFAFFGSVQTVFENSLSVLHVSLNDFVEQIYASGPVYWNRIEQGNYYKVLYDGEKKERIIETKQDLIPGNRYEMAGKKFTVKGKKNFKLSLEDIDNIRVLTEGYTDGTGKDIYLRMMQAWERKVPNVHFTNEEKDFLGYIYHENEYLGDDDRISLEKVLDIKVDNKEVNSNKLHVRKKGR